MKTYKLYILDLDGTLYRGSEAIPFAAETVSRLRERGALIRFLTNNSGRTRAFLADKLRNMGFEASPEEFYTSGMGAAGYCRRKGHGSAFLVGEDGLRDEFQKVGIEESHERPDVVVAGICRHFTYALMNEALQHILAGAAFVATNPDRTYPLEGGRLEPGAGAIVASIRECSGVDPVVIGKPNPLLVRMILEETGIPAEETLVVGDRIETDLECGAAAGCQTHLVLTGVTASAPAGMSWSEDLRGLSA